MATGLRTDRTTDSNVAKAGSIILRSRSHSMADSTSVNAASVDNDHLAMREGEVAGQQSLTLLFGDLAGG